MLIVLAEPARPLPAAVARGRNDQVAANGKNRELNGRIRWVDTGESRQIRNDIRKSCTTDRLRN